MISRKINSYGGGREILFPTEEEILVELVFCIMYINFAQRGMALGEKLKWLLGGFKLLF